MSAFALMLTSSGTRNGPTISVPLISPQKQDTASTVLTSQIVKTISARSSPNDASSVWPIQVNTSDVDENWFWEIYLHVFVLNSFDFPH